MIFMIALNEEYFHTCHKVSCYKVGRIEMEAVYGHAWTALIDSKQDVWGRLFGKFFRSCYN